MSTTTTNNRKVKHMTKINAKAVSAFMAMLNEQQTSFKPRRSVKGKKMPRRVKTAGTKATDEQIEAARAKNSALVVETFTAAGFTDVQPRVNVLTYGKWEEQGYKVRKGEKGTRVGNFNLFHVSQVDPIGAEVANEVNEAA